MKQSLMEQPVEQKIALFNKVYDILVSLGGALEGERDSFVYSFARDPQPSDEWRFGGKFGFGGKYHLGINQVTCYREDHNVKVSRTITAVNSALAALEV